MKYWNGFARIGGKIFMKVLSSFSRFFFLTFPSVLLTARAFCGACGVRASFASTSAFRPFILFPEQNFQIMSEHECHAAGHCHVNDDVLCAHNLVLSE